MAIIKNAIKAAGSLGSAAGKLKALQSKPKQLRTIYPNTAKGAGSKMPKK